MKGTDSRALLAEAPDEMIRVRNVAYGGLCIESPRPLLTDGVYQFWLNLGVPFHEVVFATVRVCWVEQVGDSFRCGAQIIETNRPWLGPMEGWRGASAEEKADISEVKEDPLEPESASAGLRAATG